MGRVRSLVSCLEGGDALGLIQFGEAPDGIYAAKLGSFCATSTRVEPPLPWWNSQVAMTRYLKITDACRYASVSRNTMRRLIESGDVCAVKIPGGQWRVDRESIDRMMESSDREKAVAILKEIGL